MRVLAPLYPPTRCCRECNGKFYARDLCRTCYDRWRQRNGRKTPPRDPYEKFWRQVQKSEGCWLWLGKRDQKGYGTVRWKQQQKGAHRVSYEALVGPIPEGLTLDHLCRVRNCVNPAHLEPVTHRENVLRGTSIMAVNSRKTHCLRGHELTPENIYVCSSQPTSRRCKTCHLQRQRDARRRGGGART